MYTKTANRVHIHNLSQEATPKIGVASFCVIPSELSQLVRPLVTFSIIVTSGKLLNKVKTICFYFENKSFWFTFAL